MPTFDVQCDACGHTCEVWANSSDQLVPFECECGEGQKKRIFTLSVSRTYRGIVGDGVWRMEVKSKDIGNIAPGRKGEPLRVENDGSKKVI